MIVIRNTQRKIPIDRTIVQAQAAAMLNALGYNGFDLGILFCTKETIRRYNALYRKIDKPTDILSFSAHPHLKPGERITPHSAEEKSLGDLIICPLYVLEDIERWGVSFEQRLDQLLAHGIAHLLGYDHQTDAEFKIMQKIEKKLLKSIKSRSS